MNSRFGILLEEMSPTLKKTEKHKEKDKDKEKERKNKKEKEKQTNRVGEKERTRVRETREKHNYNTQYRSKYSDIKEKQPPQQTNYVFDDMSFPDLGSSVHFNKVAEPDISTQTQPQTNYLDIAIMQKPIEYDLEEEEKRTMGWVYYTRENNKVIVNDYSQTGTLGTKKQEASNYNIVYKELCDKYIQWKNKYIATWGYDQYKKLYLFPNYDYDYFDRLDLNDGDNDDCYMYDDCDYDTDDSFYAKQEY